MTNTDHETHAATDEDQQDDAAIGVAFRWSIIVLVAFLLAGSVWGYLLWKDKQEDAPKESELASAEEREIPSVELPRIPFTEITKEAGIDFIHENGANGEKLLPETMGGGCAFFDYDSDGDQDLLLVNSMRWPWDRIAGARATSALYENDGTGKFTNVTAGSGLDVTCYGQGVAISDYDADGDPDVYLTAVGTNFLFRNDGDGKFTNVTAAAGVGGKPTDWGTSAGWFDCDNDGDLDLFVCNYVAWSREYDRAQNFQLTGGGRAYGRPQNFPGVFSTLYRNDGAGRFIDVSEAAGLHVTNPATGVPMGKSLGVTFDDFDQDGWLDIVVSNDTVQNFLFHNQRDGTFEEIGAIAGIAFDPNGNARGAMGIDAARFRNNGATGVAIGNFSNEMTALYVAKRNDMLFTDEAVASGLGPSTRLELTFGLFFADFDLDSRLDLFAANGHLEEEINRVQPSQFYEQPPQLFWNCGPQFDTEFIKLTTEQVGEEFLEPIVGRGATYADIDGDGDLDVLITAVGKPPRLLRNDQDCGHNWLRVKLQGEDANPSAIGAVVQVKLQDKTLTRRVMPTRGYLSQVELPVTFGLGDNQEIEELKVIWPDGSEQVVGGVVVNQQIELSETTNQQ